VWAWRDLPPFTSNMYLGVFCCENRMLVNARNAGIDIVDVGIIFNAIHVHWNTKRPHTNDEGGSYYYGMDMCNINWRIVWRIDQI